MVPVDIKGRQIAMEILRKGKVVGCRWMPRGSAVTSKEIAASADSIAVDLKTQVARALRRNRHVLLITVILDS